MCGPRCQLCNALAACLALIACLSCLQRVLRFDPGTGKVRTLIGIGVGGNGNGFTVPSAEPSKASLESPYAAAATDLASGCKLYISGVNSHLIWVVDGEYVSKFAGSAGVDGSAGDGGTDLTATRFKFPKGLLWDSVDNYLVIADSGNNVSAASVAAVLQLPPCFPMLSGMLL